MDTKKLFDLLILIGGITNKKWDTVMKLVEFISQAKAEIKEQGWHDEWKQKYDKLDLSKLTTWSTYNDTCIELKFSANPNDSFLTCHVEIYDGNTMDGRRQRLRFTATLIVSKEFLPVLSNHIMYRFESFLEEAYEIHLEDKKNTWIKNLRESILNKD